MKVIPGKQKLIRSAHGERSCLASVHKGLKWLTAACLARNRPGYPVDAPYERKRNNMSSTLLWVIAVILVIVGIVQLLQGQILFGAVLIVLGCLVGPGGYSIFRGRTRHSV